MSGRWEDVPKKAEGHWLSILPALGVASQHLTNKHGPCPICRQGKDRFRFDNKKRGMWICSACDDAGDGFTLLMRLHGWDFKRAREEVLAQLKGGAAIDPANPNKDLSAEDHRRLKRELWKLCKPVYAADMVASYLRHRGIHLDTFPKDLLRCEECPVSGVPGIHTMGAMVAVVRGPDGKHDTLHRTYISGGDKAKFDAPRRLMPGPIAKGAAIRLSPHEPGRPMGIAEGIETALAAEIQFGMPVWAAVSSGMLEKWEPPEGIDSVMIFGDHDESYGGHAAAYALAYRLKCRSINVAVLIPHSVGMDWLDVLVERRGKGEPARGTMAPYIEGHDASLAIDEPHTRNLEAT